MNQGQAEESSSEWAKQKTKTPHKAQSGHTVTTTMVVMDEWTVTTYGHSLLHDGSAEHLDKGPMWTLQARLTIAL